MQEFHFTPDHPLFSASRALTHKALMGSILASGLDPSAPRADAQLTWRTTPSGIVARARDDLTFSFHAPPASHSDPAPSPHPGVFRVDIVTQRHRIGELLDPEVAELYGSRRGRSRLVPVPPGDVASWFADKMSRAGVQVSDVDVVSHNPSTELGRGRGCVPHAVIQFYCDDVEALAPLWSNGVGKCKNYGFGQILQVS